MSDRTYVTYVDLLEDHGPTEMALYGKYLRGELPAGALAQFEMKFMSPQRVLMYKAMRVLDRVERLIEHYERREGLIE